MLTSLHIQNFKAWKDTGEIRLAPLTVIFGVNSAGKSSLGHLMLALKQTAASSDRRRPLYLGDSGSLIDLGTFADCIHGHNDKASLSFSLGWELPSDMKVKDPLNGNEYVGNELRLEATIREQNGQPVAESITYQMLSDKTQILDVSIRRKPSNKYKLESKTYDLKHTVGRNWDLPEAVKFYGFPDEAKAYHQNAGFISDLELQTESMLRNFYYLGPLRVHPRRTYPWAGNAPADVGGEGEHTIAAILAAKDHKLSRGPKKRTHPFEVFIAQWLRDLGLIHAFQVKSIAEGRKEFEVLVQTSPEAALVKLPDVGFGISQVLPTLVQAFYAPPNATVWMEQPEIHLHPQVQANLADVFIGAIKARENGLDRNVQLIIESHSEHFLNRLQRRVAEGEISTEDVAVYFCHRKGKAVELEPLRLNLYGEIENWPDNFFGNEMEDIAGRTRAAIERRKKETKDAPSEGSRG